MAMDSDRSAKLAHESIPRLLLAFSLPAIVGMMAQALYNIIDRIFIGRAIGAAGIAGATIAWPATLILLAFGMLIGIGSAALISIRLGEQRKAEAERVLGHATVLLTATAVILTIVGLVFLDDVLRLSGATEEVMPLARDFLRILVLGAVFQMVSFGLNAAIRAEGNPRIAMLTMLISVLLNAVLAPIFLFVFHWGMKGAAAATVSAQAVAAVWVLAYFLRGKSHVTLHWRNLRLTGPLCLSIFIMGSPHFAMQLAGSVLNCLLNNQLGRYGALSPYGSTASVSVMGILTPLFMLFAMPVFGLNQGAQPIIGYNYGAQRFDRVKKTLETAILAATGLTLTGFALAMAAPGQIVRLFAPGDPVLVELGSHAIRISMLMFPMVGFQIVGASYFQAVGKPAQAMLLSLSRQVLLLIPVVMILPRFFGLNGVWIALPTTDLVSSLLTAIWLALELRHLGRRHGARSDVPG
jgi:putative MATE family efflux protein